MPADERAHYLEMLAIEVKVARATADLGPDDELAPDYFDDDED